MSAFQTTNSVHRPLTASFPSRLEKAEIIPTVLDSFLPSINLTIFWANATSELGNTVDPSLMQRHPDATGYLFPGVELSNKIQLVMGVTDPDAPSRDNPEWSEICHWLAVLKQDRDDDSDSDSDGAVDAFDKKKYYELMEYKPPGPPPKTGKHRYVFVLLAPINRTTEALHLTKPADRQHWGYKEERQGLRKWASNHGLEPIGMFILTR